MLDIQYIRDNPDLVAQKSQQKGYPVDITQLLGFDDERRQLLQEVEELRRQRNELSGAMKGAKPSDEQIAAGRELRDKLNDLEHKLSAIEQEFITLLKTVPNMPADDVPVGATEEENVVVKTVGEPTKFDFEPKHDQELGEQWDLIDKERAAKIAGSRFAYLKGDLVRLQMAVMQFVFQALGDEAIIGQLVKDNNLSVSSKPFTPVLPPVLLRTEPYVASARLNAEEVTYKIEQDDMWLTASAEHTLCTMYWNEVLPEEQLPIRYIGYATSFRREAGTYGKDVEGIFRMHQFDKLEMEVFSTPETGLQEHLLAVAIQEYLVQQIGLPYRVLNKCTADIGKPNARGIDIECWFPGQGKYRETHSADYISDYQARDLKTRVKRKDGTHELVHTNDATAFALGRILKAILENNQQADGHIVIPPVLRPFMSGQAQI
ncbi:MAG: serS [Candidatus Saccharibacteria bacterium]|nr:serS [Candidatus Saccharibacteria bacterium]